MAPPPLPLNPASPNALRSSGLVVDNTGVGAGPGQLLRVSPVETTSDSDVGPLRHPRPMTPAELHLELEKEQEGIV